MPWLWPRLLAVALALAAGMVLGGGIGGWVGAQTLGVALGGATGVVLLTVVDTLRAQRLLRWLRGAATAAAPPETGFWGELGHRVERAVRSRERQIEAEQLRLQQFIEAIEASPNGVLLLDAGDHIDWCNAVAADHFGLDPVRDRGQRVTNLIRSPGFVAYLNQRRFDTALLLPAMLNRLTLQVLVRPYGDGLKLVVSQDITERERHDAMRRDFVANVSHEMRTPLTVLTGFIETMTTLPLTEGERQRVLRLMEQQATRMQSLLTDLLTLAQLEGSPRPPTDRWLPVDALLAQIRADGEALSGGRHRLAFHVAAGSEIAGSHGELLSAVGNLVGNAVRYTPEGGQIDVHWRLRGDGGGELDVVDTGVGIAREHLPRLTERFYRVDSSRARDTGGTGLGLSIVKHVVQRHGGELDIASEPGKGSRFRIVLPAVRVRQRTGALPAGVAK